MSSRSSSSRSARARLLLSAGLVAGLGVPGVVAGQVGPGAGSGSAITRSAVTSPNACIPQTGSTGWCGDGFTATSAKLAGPRAIAVVGDGSVIVADTDNNIVRRVTPDGGIMTIGGTGVRGYSGDGGQVSSAEFNAPAGIAVIGDGGYLVADTGNNVVRRVSPDGKVATVAGTGEAGYTGDNGPGTAARLTSPEGLALVGDGSALVADTGNNVIRKLGPDGTIVTVAGTGARGYGGDGGRAVDAKLNGPTGIALTGDGGFVIADRGNQVVRLVSRAGQIATLTGPHHRVALHTPSAVAPAPTGGYYVADAGAVVLIDPAGARHVVAGTGSPGFSGDGTKATATQLDHPADLAVASQQLLVADSGNDRIRRVATGGALTLFAGLRFSQPAQHKGSADARWRDLTIRPPAHGPLRRNVAHRFLVPVISSVAAKITATIISRAGRLAATCGPHRIVPKKTTQMPCPALHRSGRYKIALHGAATGSTATKDVHRTLRARFPQPTRTAGRGG